MNSRHLADAIACAKRGPSFSFVTFNGFTKEQQATVDRAMRVWLDSWIIPAMEEAMPRSRAAVNLDCMTIDELQAFHDKQGFAQKSTVRARYVRAKMHAMSSRLEGKINEALRTEQLCESLYAMLPARERW